MPQGICPRFAGHTHPTSTPYLCQSPDCRIRRINAPHSQWRNQIMPLLTNHLQNTSCVFRIPKPATQTAPPVRAHRPLLSVALPLRHALPVALPLRHALPVALPLHRTLPRSTAIKTFFARNAYFLNLRSIHVLIRCTAGDCANPVFFAFSLINSALCAAAAIICLIFWKCASTSCGVIFKTSPNSAL